MFKMFCVFVGRARSSSGQGATAMRSGPRARTQPGYGCGALDLRGRNPVARVRIPAGLFRRCYWGTIVDFQHTDMEWLIYELNGVRRPMQDLTVGVGSAVAFSPLRRLAEGAYCVA